MARFIQGNNDAPGLAVKVVAVEDVAVEVTL
jgi:hypothetical protein